MIQFDATYFDGITSRARKAKVSIGDGILRIEAEDLRPQTYPLKGCAIAPPLGNTSRSITLPGGALCETQDLKAVTQLEKRLGRNRGLRLVNYLESRWKAAAGCAAGLIICVWGFIHYDIPFMAEKAASAVPAEINETISRKTMAFLDSRYLHQSQLTKARRDEIRALMAPFSRGENTPGYTLEFRQGKALGPNAFALPSGLIVMTDELVALAEDDRELAGILRHEAAHVAERHGLRSLFQNAGVFLLISILAGDVTSITSTAATLPALLAESRYSRQFEKEADYAAGIYCIGKGWTTAPLRNILARLNKERAGLEGASLLASHPATAERLKALLALEERMVTK